MTIDAKLARTVGFFIVMIGGGMVLDGGPAAWGAGIFLVGGAVFVAGVRGMKAR